MKSTQTLIPVILSGGSGSRLWPQSRSSRPKQFVDLIGDETLFAMSVNRSLAVSDIPSIIVTNQEHRFLVAEELRSKGVEGASIILEPSGRNTAPAAVLAALKAVEIDENALMLISPADHLIEDMDAFIAAVGQGVDLAEKGKIVTFGIKPSHAETGYGYIAQQKGESHAISEFVEKPNKETAEKYLEAGNYFWNSGIFLVKAQALLDEIAKHSEAILDACSKSWAALEQDGDFTRVDKAAFFQCPSDSIDYAVMEKTRNAAMVELDCKWSDLGSWDAVWSASEQDEDGNAASGDVEMLDSSNNYVRSSSKLISLIGCDNLVIVEEGDSILVADKSRSQDVKLMVEELRKDGRSEPDTHSRVYRPWGNYEGIDRGERYQVKRIVVKPQEQLSLQMHHHRAEHWIVVKGTAIVTCGDEEKLVGENESTYIPFRAVHRLENPGKVPLELIEVQSGSYLGEDDIVRLEDRYGRNKPVAAGDHDAAMATPIAKAG